MIIPRAHIQGTPKKTMTNKGTTTMSGPTSSPSRCGSLSPDVGACGLRRER
jgi:hypothetical protein